MKTAMRAIILLLIVFWFGKVMFSPSLPPAPSRFRRAGPHRVVETYAEHNECAAQAHEVQGFPSDRSSPNRNAEICFAAATSSHGFWK